NAHGEGGWLKELSVPRVGTVGYFCSASLAIIFNGRVSAVFIIGIGIMVFIVVTKEAVFRTLERSRGLSIETLVYSVITKAFGLL
ncbi:hypothetical protein, partial [Pseudomonas amygdali]|uniref:hypothetical protein n=1 Tax=Pseudomonas amygdali TaxID=47877 RepID=UPI001F2A65B8